MTWKVYISPLTAEGQFGSFQEITFDTIPDSISDISIDTQKNEYGVGLPGTSNVEITLRNNDGKFSDVGSTNSIFKFRRSGSKVKITWHENEEAILGFAICGQAILGSEFTIFEGFIDDLDAEQEIKTSFITFSVLGKESIFPKAETPFASLNIGDLMSDAIFTVLNQSLITDLLTVDIGNFTLGRDQELDDIDDFENTTVDEALKDLLEMSNSILIIQDDIIYVSDRSPSAEVKKTFYGQASDAGLEDIQNLSGITNGQSKVFNFWTWEGSSLVYKSQGSIDAYGVSKEKISFTQITDTTKRENVLSDYGDEFDDRKREMKLLTRSVRDVLSLTLLDKVQVDYPIPVTPGEIGGVIPIWGYFVWGEFKWPIKLWNFKITLDDFFKILSIKISIKNNTVELTLREI